MNIDEQITYVIAKIAFYESSNDEWVNNLRALKAILKTLKKVKKSQTLEYGELVTNDLDNPEFI